MAPFKVGRTNEPGNYKSSSNTKWKARRIVNEKDSLFTPFIAVIVISPFEITAFTLLAVSVCPLKPTLKETGKKVLFESTEESSSSLHENKINIEIIDK